MFLLQHEFVVVVYGVKRVFYYPATPFTKCGFRCWDVLRAHNYSLNTENIIKSDVSKSDIEQKILNVYILIWFLT